MLAVLQRTGVVWCYDFEDVGKEDFVEHMATYPTDLLLLMDM